VQRVPNQGITAAYDAQDRLVRSIQDRTGWTRGGYKIGLTSERMQAMCKIDSPIAGVIFRENIDPSGVRLSAAAYGRLALEFEIGLVMGPDLEIASVCPAIEIVDDQNADYAALDIHALIGENSWNAGAVCGTAVTQIPNLATLAGIVSRDGEVIDRGAGRDVLGDPRNALAWLATHLDARGGRVAAGDLVMTGNLVTTKFVRPGETYRFELTGLGSVEVHVVP
jgi:2-keto-4-pentenoate hydratase